MGVWPHHLPFNSHCHWHLRLPWPLHRPKTPQFQERKERFLTNVQYAKFIDEECRKYSPPNYNNQPSQWAQIKRLRLWWEVLTDQQSLKPTSISRQRTRDPYHFPWWTRRVWTIKERQSCYRQGGWYWRGIGAAARRATSCIRERNGREISFNRHGAYRGLEGEVILVMIVSSSRPPIRMDETLNYYAWILGPVREG